MNMNMNMNVLKLGIFTCMVMLALCFSPFSNAGGGDLRMERHQTSGVIDLDPGAERGTITQPLLKGTIALTGQEVLFVVTDASDTEFADLFGAIRADVLAEAPESAVEHATFQDGNWTFAQDPGLVARLDGNGNLIPPVPNPNYSPLKRIKWKGKVITVNVPFIKWGDEPGQELIVDQGGCDSLIRKNPPSPLSVAGGPPGPCSIQVPLDRYKGGQAVDLDLQAMTVTMKLHKGTFDHPNVFPYYTVFEAAHNPAAAFMGVIHAPKLSNLGRFGDNPAVAKIAQFANGVRIDAGGPERFQQGITSYPGGQSKSYSPMWYITFAFFDCNRNGIFFDASHNVGEGAIPVAGSGIPGFDPADPVTFDPFGMDDKGVSCLGFASQVTGRPDGFIKDLGQLANLVKAGHVIETEGPPGLRLKSALSDTLGPLIVNCPVPVTLKK